MKFGVGYLAGFLAGF